MTGRLQPLDEKFPIVGPDGRPTLYFTRWAQQRMQDIGVAISEAEANILINQIIDQYEIQAGSGIDIVPDGKLSSNPTISTDVQAILDQITTTHGSILYRDAAAWAALAPGVAGQFLKTNGAGADPEWAAAGGGGGSAWSLVSTVDLSISPVAAIPFTGLGAYSEILLIGRATTTSVSSFRGLLVSTDNGASYFNTAGNYERNAITGILSNQMQIDGISNASANARNFYIHLMATNVDGAPKPYLTTSLLNGFFVGSFAPINAVQAVTTAGNFNGGNLYLLGR
jgi:hypothetical protein